MKIKKEINSSFIIGFVFTFIGVIWVILGVALSGLSGFVFGIFGVLGAAFLGAGLSYLYFYKKNIDKHQSLFDEGKYVMAQIESILRDETVKVNGRHPYYVLCSFINPDDNKKYTFKSGNYVENLNEALTNNEVRVYINPENLDEYYVDLDSLIKK